MTRRRALPGRLVTVVTIGVGAIWLLLDQATKTMAEELLPAPPSRVNLGILDLRLVYNEGAAFGLRVHPLTFTVVTAAVLILVTRALRRTDRLGLALAYGLVCGGALGNVVDRITRPPYFPGGAVVDFIDLRWWPVFNLADIGIVVGAVLIAVLLTLVEREEREEERAREAQESVRPETGSPRK